MNRLKELVEEYEDDLRACHEYYCKVNCGTLSGGNSHTPRCDKLRGAWGFPAQKPLGEADLKKT